jgi:hypothetical protein
MIKIEVRTKMHIKILSFKFLALVVAILLPVAAFGFVNNGDFEGGFYTDSNDIVPVSWEKVETFDPNHMEGSDIYPVDDNGPAAPGENAMHFSRFNGGTSGDWTAIRQDLNIAMAPSGIGLWIDVQALSHNLCGGGWSGAWEYPIGVTIDYQDPNGDSKLAQVGWYLDTSDTCDATDHWTWREDSGRWAKSRQIAPDMWYTESIDLKDPNLNIDTITGITVGGAGWDFEGRADNVGIFVIAPIDIKPGSYPNSINLTSRGVLPVALLTTEDFDALTVDVDTIVLGDLKAGGTASPTKINEEDVDDDGDTDLIVFFSTPELVANGALNTNSTQACMTGMTDNGEPFRGCDSVRIVPPKKTETPAWNRNGANGPPWINTDIAGPPWSLPGATNGPPWYQPQTGGPSPAGPAWFQTGYNGPWWASRIVPSSSTNGFNGSGANGFGFGGSGNGTLGPPWYQFNIGGPQWYGSDNFGPWWYQASLGVSSIGPSWFQAQSGGPSWFLNGQGGPWWASMLP